MPQRLHKDEIQVDLALVRRLVDNAFPDLSGLEIHRLSATGSTNVQFRLGDELLLRFPRQPGGSAAIDKEHRWTQVIGRHLPVAVPEFVAVGEPALGYPERWSIVRWQGGEHPNVCDPENPAEARRTRLAGELAEVVIALRQIDVSEAARSDDQLHNYRGRGLIEHDSQMRRNIERCRSIQGLDLDLDAALLLWDQALTLPGASGADVECWYHGDLVAENLLLNDGQLTGVLDFGGLGVGDPSVDLHGAWELFDAPARDEFRKRLEVDDAQWLRGRAWALAIGIMTFPYYWRTMPGRIADRLAMARSVLADALNC